MSNYPPGVTGMEWQVAGPAYETEREEERDVEHECSDELYFEGRATVLVTDCGPEYIVTTEWTCPACGVTVEGEEDWEE